MQQKKTKKDKKKTKKSPLIKYFGLDIFRKNPPFSFLKR